MYHLVRFTRLRLISVTLQCGLGLSRCRRRRRRRLRGRSSATTAVAADAKDRNSKNRRRRRRLFKTFVVQDVITHAVLSPGQQLIIDSAPSNRSKIKPQPTSRHCRLTGLNHALTYSNLAPISWRSEKLRRSPCTGHQVSVTPQIILGFQLRHKFH